MCLIDQIVIGVGLCFIVCQQISPIVNCDIGSKDLMRPLYVSLWQIISLITDCKLLGVEPDYLLYSKVSPHWTPVQNGGGNAARKIFAAGGVQGGADAPWRGFRGQRPRS